MGRRQGGQHVEDTGPLTKQRMETVDDATSDRAIAFIREQQQANKPWFVCWNGTRMHFRTHVKAELRGRSGQDEYSDGMVRARQARRQVPDAPRRVRHRRCHVLYRQRAALQLLARCRHHAFRSEKNSNWEGAFRVPTFVRWPGRFPADVTLNGIVP